jgi:hypothetical protein
MKLILENWKKFLKEHEDEEYEDDEEDLPLGKHVFPKELIIPDPEKSKEKNTTIENALERVISDHFLQTNLPDRGLKNSDSLKIIKDLIDRNLYPEVFKRYTEGEVYRGMYVSRKWMKEAFGDKFERLHKESGSEMVEIAYNAILPLYPGRLVSSWTTELEEAKSFANAPASNTEGSWSYGKNISLILVADASDSLNYFIDMEPFYDYNFGKTFILEAEVVGVGAIGTKKIMWADTSRETQRSEDEKGIK